MSEKNNDIEAQIHELERNLGTIPFLATRGDTFGREPNESEAQHWLRKLESWELVKRSDPVLWGKMVSGD